MNHIIYHDNCVDGFGAAFIAARHFESKDEDYVLIPHSYNDAPIDFHDLLDPSDTVFILDYSFAPDVIERICGMCKEVVWLDHHKSAIDKWKAATTIHTPEDLLDTAPANLEKILDNSRSGTGITFDYFHPVSVRPMWVNWIEDRDLWKWKYADQSKQFHAVMSSYPKNVDTWKALLIYNTDDYETLLAEGEAILRAHNQRVMEIANGGAVPIVIDGQKGLAANCNGYYASDVGHELAERSGTFGATWYQDKGGSIKWSLRAASNNQVDVAEIAEAFNGGGHKSAAGFTLSNPTANPNAPEIQVWSAVEIGDDNKSSEA